MKEDLTLEELAQELVQQSEVKQDYLVDSSRMLMEACGAAPVLRVLDDFGEDCMEPLEFTATAHKQLSSYLRIPAGYYDRMLEEAPELLTTNVNRWLRGTSEVKLLRTLDGSVRALLSNRYWCVDHLDVLRVIVPTLGSMPDATIQSCRLTDTRMYIKVTSKRLREDVVPGDAVQYGIVITNSEVGKGAISIQPYLYRLVCTNGMVSGEHLGTGSRRIHKGGVKKLFGPLRNYCPPPLEPQEKFAEQLRSTLENAMEEARFSEMLEQLRRAVGMPIEAEDLDTLLKEVGTLYGIREAEQAGVRTHLLADRDMTLYGLANAVTRFAQDVDSYDRAAQLEAAGYALVTMTPRKWNHINELAAPQAAA